MRSSSRAPFALLPLVFLACVAPAPEESSHSQSNALTSVTHPHPMDNNTQLLNMACAFASTAAGAPGACSVLSQAEMIIGLFQGLGSSDSNAQILSQLNTLNQEMVQVDNDVKGTWAAFNQAAYQIENTQQIQTQGAIGNHESDAKDAAVRLATWVADGQTDSLLIAAIDTESSQAAMDLTTDDRSRLNGRVLGILSKGSYSRDALLKEIRRELQIHLRQKPAPSSPPADLAATPRP